MGLDVSGLRYFGLYNDKYNEEISSNKANFIDFSSNKDKAKKLMDEHTMKTDALMQQYYELYRKGKLNSAEYKMAKLEASANDIIYQLGVKTLYDI